MISLKSGVRPRSLNPAITLAIMVADGVYSEYGYNTIITSLNDGIHGRGSLHYSGQAVDLRTRHLTKSVGGVTMIDRDLTARIHRGIKLSLINGDYDVILEKDHIHIEFQPKSL